MSNFFKVEPQRIPAVTAYGYQPKTRLTFAQTKVRDELIIARSDYAKYTSMLNAMPQHASAKYQNQAEEDKTPNTKKRTCRRLQITFSE